MSFCKTGATVKHQSCSKSTYFKQIIRKKKKPDRPATIDKNRGILSEKSVTMIVITTSFTFTVDPKT